MDVIDLHPHFKVIDCNAAVSHLVPVKCTINHVQKHFKWCQQDIIGHGKLRVQPQMLALHLVKERLYVFVLSKMLLV